MAGAVWDIAARPPARLAARRAAAGHRHRHVLEGMGLIVLHAGLFSKIFRRLMGPNCSLKWREADLGDGQHLRPDHLRGRGPVGQGL